MFDPSELTGNQQILLFFIVLAPCTAHGLMFALLVLRAVQKPALLGQESRTKHLLLGRRLYWVFIAFFCFWFGLMYQAAYQAILILLLISVLFGVFLNWLILRMLAKIADLLGINEDEPGRLL